MRLKATDPSTGEYWQMDFVGVFQTYNHGEAGPFQDLTLVAKSQRDATLGYSWQQVVSHDDASSLDYRAACNTAFRGQAGLLWPGHEGIDLAAPNGTPHYCMADGAAGRIYI